ncbi:hypothetical protein [Sphingobacterium sp. LRF_L2]|uniref:hypothetical protein n=1 Tax=Sphingobacterium sp. LRF_L2 TaxID=3369421 RepID=UPI003F632483
MKLLHLKSLVRCFVIIAITLISCAKDDLSYTNLSEEELSELEREKYDAIQAFAQPEVCTDPSVWLKMDMNSVCGEGRLIYHESVDVAKLKVMVEDYNALIKVYAPLISAFISCEAFREPSGIVCEEGKPVFIYDEEVGDN